MTSMVERVARAMYPKGWEQDGHFNSRERAWRRDHAMIAARAAIEAMREPTPGMLSDGLAIHDWDHGLDDVYTAMIDAALEPLPEPPK